MRGFRRKWEALLIRNFRQKHRKLFLALNCAAVLGLEMLSRWLIYTKYDPEPVAAVPDESGGFWAAQDVLSLAWLVFFSLTLRSCVLFGAARRRKNPLRIFFVFSLLPLPARS